MTNIAIENALKMMIVHRCVSLPEGSTRGRCFFSVTHRFAFLLLRRQMTIPQRTQCLNRAFAETFLSDLQILSRK